MYSTCTGVIPKVIGLGLSIGFSKVWHFAGGQWSAHVGNSTSPHVKRTEPHRHFLTSLCTSTSVLPRVCILLKGLKMTNSADEELVASKTEGFKVGEKKTLEEYAKLGERAFTYLILRLVSSTSTKHLYLTMLYQLPLMRLPNWARLMMLTSFLTPFRACLRRYSP